jgi:hypothetical protein
MTETMLRDRIAPCGLDCGRCLDNPDSPIGRLARELARELGGFGKRAAFFARLDPAFAAYPEFESLLGRLGRGGCGGCRTGNCLLADCRVKDCVRERGVDFCFQCPDFSACDPGLPPGLAERWRDNNRHMAAIGIKAYVVWLDDQPRY